MTANTVTEPSSQHAARGPARGIVLYDGQCGFCTRWVNYWAPTLVAHGFTIAALNEPWIAEKLKMPLEELIADIRLITVENNLVSGADVYLYVARRIWWAWPFYAIFSLPGFNRLIHAAYRSFARNRYCVSHACRLNPH
jgi:predicted DCC family thiol-disulfide oxidoreductase YuxK